MTVEHTLWVRTQVLINTDSQRRCYDGHNYTSEMRWTDWGVVCTYSKLSLEEVQDTQATFQRINPSRQYKITTQELEGSFK